MRGEVNQIPPTCNSNVYIRPTCEVFPISSHCHRLAYIRRPATCCYRLFVLERQNLRCGAIDILFPIRSANMEDLVISLQMKRICNNEQPAGLLKIFLFRFVSGACRLKLQFRLSSQKRLTADALPTFFFYRLCDSHRFSVTSQ